ncbi:MAG: rhodanese-like domain-containing protein [Gammaproteobacteria bacterium]
MNTPILPLVVEPKELADQLQNPNLALIHITKPEVYSKHHLPGARFVAGSRFVRIEKPIMGLLPDLTTLSTLLSSLGINNDTHIVAYDDEGGGWAGRLLWTLDVIGHRHFSLLNGGLVAWFNEGFPVDQAQVEPVPDQYNIAGTTSAQSSCEYIMSRLGAADFALLDSRTPDEFNGVKKLASRGGHIPGAANLNWLDTMDKSRNIRFLPDAELRAQLASRGLTPDKEIVCYCQSHHRSSHAYIMLKKLGYERISGYPGAWSEWGNRPDTPLG